MLRLSADRTLPPLAWLKADQHQRIADFFAAGLAASLPWSTSATSIMIALWAISLVPTIDPERLRSLLARPACYLPIVFVGLALLGIIWSDATWTARLHAFGTNLKLLAIPVLAYQFSRSRRAHWVAGAFIGSGCLLMILSWIITVYPSLSLKKDGFYGVPVKNYIDQSQVFTFCAIFSLWPALHFYKTKRPLPAIGLVVVALLFLLNMALVNVSRTAILTIPVLILAFAVTQLKRRQAVAMVALAILGAAAFGALSPLVRAKVSTIYSESNSQAEGARDTSGGMRLQYWREAARLFATAPIIGYGTGSIYAQFARAREAGTGYTTEAVANPHNQVLYAAIQWGIIGVVVLLAMWAIHFGSFLNPGLAQGAGVIVVIQNVIGSQFNSHLTDFVPGWMYVLGVGVALGCACQSDANRDDLR